VINKYKTEELITFLRRAKDLQLNEAHFKILRKEEINGRSFFKLTEQKLERYGMKGGPATVLADFAEEIENSSYDILLKYNIDIESISQGKLALVNNRDEIVSYNSSKANLYFL